MKLPKKGTPKESSEIRESPPATTMPSVSERSDNRLPSHVETYDYQWNLHPSKFKFLRKPLALAKIPESRIKTSLPKDKMMDSLRTNRSVFVHVNITPPPLRKNNLPQLTLCSRVLWALLNT